MMKRIVQATTARATAAMNVPIRLSSSSSMLRLASRTNHTISSYGKTTNSLLFRCPAAVMTTTATAQNRSNHFSSVSSSNHFGSSSTISGSKIQPRSHLHQQQQEYKSFRLTTTSNNNRHRYLSSSSNDTNDASSSNNTIPSDSTTPPNLYLSLYQYKICPYCNRVKALLDYIGIPYDAIEVNPITKSELKIVSKENNGYNKVPILSLSPNDDSTEGQRQQDLLGSDEIIQALLENPIIVSKLQQRWMMMGNDDDSNKPIMTMDHFMGTGRWTEFGMNQLAVLLYPNICRTLSDSYMTFGYVANVSTFNTIEKVYIRLLGTLAMYVAASKVKQKRGIIDEQKELEEAIVKFETDGLFSPSRGLYLSGLPEPNMDDISMFGILRSIEGLPTHKRILYDRPDGQPLLDWYQRMTNVVGGGKQ